jgi:spore coat protein U-like protein
MKRAALLIGVLLFARAAHAGNCTFTSPGPSTLDFGTYQPFSSSPLQQLMSFTVNCVPPETVTVQFSTGGSAGFDPRQMAFGANGLSYNIYRNAGRTEILGNGSGGTFTLSKTMALADRDLIVNVYGQIPINQDVPASSPSLYIDQITVTIIWSGGSKSDTRTFQVQARVDPECIVATAPLAFGSYDPVSANATTPLDGTGTVNVYCTPGTAATVLLDLGSNASGSTRQMLGPSANLLQYEIYRNAGRTLIWGSTIPTANSGTSTSINTAINNGFSAYGRIPAGQDVIFGNYSDSVLVTVNY